MPFKFNPTTSRLDYYSGDVTGPSSSTDNAIATYNGTSGKVIQNTLATVKDSGAVNSRMFVSAKVVDTLIEIPDEHSAITTGLSIEMTGGISIGVDSTLVIL